MTLTLQQWLVIGHFLSQKGRRTQNLQFLNSQPAELWYPLWYPHVTQNYMYVALWHSYVPAVLELMVCMFSPNTWYPQCQLTFNPTFLMNIQLKNSALMYQACWPEELKCTPNLMCWSLEFATQRTLPSVEHRAHLRIVEPRAHKF